MTQKSKLRFQIEKEWQAVPKNIHKNFGTVHLTQSLHFYLAMLITSSKNTVQKRASLKEFQNIILHIFRMNAAEIQTSFQLMCSLTNSNALQKRMESSLNLMVKFTFVNSNVSSL